MNGVWDACYSVNVKDLISTCFGVKRHGDEADFGVNLQCM